MTWWAGKGSYQAAGPCATVTATSASVGSSIKRSSASKQPRGANGRGDLLHPLLFARRAEFVARVPGRQSVGVGHGAGHVEVESGQHGEAREIPVRLHLVLWRVVHLVVERLVRADGEVFRLALDPHSLRDRERRHARLGHREMVRAVEDTEVRPL